MLREPTIHFLGTGFGTGEKRFLLVMETHTWRHDKKMDEDYMGPGKIYRADVTIPGDVNDNNALYYAAAMRNGWQKILDDVAAGRTAVEGDEWNARQEYAVIPGPRCGYGRGLDRAREQRKESRWQRLKKWAGTLIPKRNSGAR